MHFRPALLAAVDAALNRAPVVALLGPRQCGKTTLARQLVPADSANYFDISTSKIRSAWSGSTSPSRPRRTARQGGDR